MSRDRSSIDPALMELDVELGYIQKTGSKSRRVKMNRGESWLLRFLPARLGPKGAYYARIAKHWNNVKPIVCLRHTSPDFGGIEDYECPVCATAEELNDNSDEAISKFGYKAMAQAQWLTYCVVFEKGTTQGTIQCPEAEIFIPYEFNHYKSTFEELASFYRNAKRANNPNSVLDWVQGCDFWVNKTGKGMRLDKQEPAPLIDGLTEEAIATHPTIKKLMDAMKTPKVQIPTEAELRIFSDKVYEAGMKAVEGDDSGRGSSRGSSRGGGRGRPPEDDGGAQEHDDEPPRQPAAARRPAPPAAAAPARRPAPPAAAPARRAVAPPPPPEEDQIPGAEMPAEEPPAEELPAEDPPIEGDGSAEDPNAAPAEEPAAEEPPVEEEAPAPPPRRPAPAPARAPAAPARAPAPAATRAAAPAAQRPTAPPVSRPAVTGATPRPAVAGATPRPAVTGTTPRPVTKPGPRPAPAPLKTNNEKIDDDPEVLPEEATDQAPAEPLPAEDEGAAPPPPVRRAGGSGLGAGIRGRVNNLTQRAAQ